MWCYFVAAGPTLEDVCKLLESEKYKWKEVASKAGFSEEEMETVVEKCEGKEQEDCLKFVVEQWFTRHAITWEQLLQLMKKVGLEEKALEVAAKKG